MAVSNGGIEVIIIISSSFAFAFPKATEMGGGSGSHFPYDRAEEARSGGAISCKRSAGGCAAALDSRSSLKLCRSSITGNAAKCLGSGCGKFFAIVFLLLCLSLHSESWMCSEL